MNCADPARLFGIAAAGLIAVAVAIPALAQATFPDGTDCSAISNAARRTACVHQMNEARQSSAAGAVVPNDAGTGNIQPARPNASSATPNPDDARSGAAGKDTTSGGPGPGKGGTTKP